MVVGQVVGKPVVVVGVHVRRRVSLGHNGDRPEQRSTVAVLSGLGGTRRVCHRAGAEQHQTVDTLRVELILQPPIALGAHPREIGHSGYRTSADRRACRPVVDGSTSLKMQR